MSPVHAGIPTMRTLLLLSSVALASLVPAALGLLPAPGAREVLLVYPPGFDAGRAAADVLRLGGVPLGSGARDNLVYARFGETGFDPSRLAGSPAWIALATRPGGLCAALLPDPE